MTRRTRAVIQARLSSSRLPGKALLPIAGLPMVVLAARRAMGHGIEVVVATSVEREDDLVAETLEEHGIDYVRGPLDDPLARFVMATRDLADADVVVRLTADNVFPDAGLVAMVAQRVDTNARTYARVGGEGGQVPYGVSVEAFLVSALRAADRLASAAYEREHVTPWIRLRFGDDQVTPGDVPPTWAGLRCTVDTLLDYERVWRVFKREPDPVGVDWRNLATRLPPATVISARTDHANVIGQSELVLGSVQIGQKYGIANRFGEPGEGEARRVLLAAADAGITHVDTARAYGRSEDRIGRALAAGLSERLRVVTKIRPLDDVPLDASPEWASAAVGASVAESLRALQSESVDVLLLHRAADLDRGQGGVRRELLRLREAGATRLVGVSVQSPIELVRALSDPACDYLQLPLNLLDARWDDPAVVDAISSRPDVILTARSVFLQGLLVADEAVPWPRIDGVDPARVRSRIKALVTELDRDSVADLCIAFVRGTDWVTSIVLGAETAEQVHENARLMRRTRLSVEEVSFVRASLGSMPEQLVDPSRWTKS